MLIAGYSREIVIHSAIDQLSTRTWKQKLRNFSHICGFSVFSSVFGICILLNYSYFRVQGEFCFSKILSWCSMQKGHVTIYAYVRLHFHVGFCRLQDICVQYWFDSHSRKQLGYQPVAKSMFGLPAFRHNWIQVSKPSSCSSVSMYVQTRRFGS